MNKLTQLIGAILAVAIVISLCFGATWLGIEWRGFFGPKRAVVEREIFHETRSYNEGMVQQLAKYRMECIRAKSDKEQAAIRSTVRHMFAEFDPERIRSFELRVFLQECKR